MELILAPRARSDIVTILAWTHENFGPHTRKRYAKLIETALAAIAADPELAGSMHRPDIAENCRTYHLIHSRKKASSRENRIRNPRQFLLYRVTEAGVVEIGRVLHESLDLDQHLPEEFRRSDE